MKKMSLIVGSIMLVLAACAQAPSVQPSISKDDQVATIVAGALSVMPTHTPIPVVPSLDLEEFPNKTLLGEDEGYSVYLINSDSGDAPEKTGEIIIYDKDNSFVYQVTGSFTFFGTVVVSHDDKGEYILLSHGSYSSRKAIVITLSEKRQAVDEFCTTTGQFGSHLFWNDYVVINNCDTFSNRPWGAGEASSVVAINLKTDLVTEIAKSDLTRHFHIQSILGDSLQYLETSVESEDDWQTPDKQNSTVQTYDLLSLAR